MRGQNWKQKKINKEKDKNIEIKIIKTKNELKKYNKMKSENFLKKKQEKYKVHK